MRSDEEVFAGPVLQQLALVDAPWCIINYFTTDQDSEELGDRCFIRLDCCICGGRKHCIWQMPPGDDPIWAEFRATGRGHPEAEAIRNRFAFDHLHPDQHGPAAMLTWAQPLRNLNALLDGVDLGQLEARLREKLKDAPDL